MTPQNVKVALSNDLLTSITRISGSKQAKVINFIQKFQANPNSPGINYEKIHVASDPNFRSVRIDDAYRGIIFKPDTGNVYVLLWVDLHDDAYAWAKKKKCTVNPETGSLQIYETEFFGEQKEVASDTIPGLFDTIHDRHLKRFGVPDDLLPHVRKLKTPDDLEAVAAKLPQEAYEALFFLADGFSIEDVYNELLTEEKPATQSTPVDQEDFASALDNPDSKRRFFIVDDDEELMAMLQAPLEKWRVFLHPKQRSLVERNWNGPVRVLGGAGTGKTVAAMHRAKWLAEQIFNLPGAKILMTTFTKNLAADIQANLRKICPDDTLKRIEVSNLDRWVVNFLRKNGYEFDIAYDTRTDSLWAQALTHAPGEPALETTFFREEWENVIQPQGITTQQEYLKASRVGRGVRLNRKDRLNVWPVFEEYRILLHENGLKEPEDAMRDARMLLQERPESMVFKSLIVDEAQDMGAQAFLLIRKMVPEGPNDLFIVGDAHQRIYRRKVVLGRCGINIVGRGKKLRINYRTTDETRAWAEKLLKGLPIDDLDGAQDENRGYKSLFHGVQPEVRFSDSFQEELNTIMAHIQKIEAQGETSSSICLVARTNNLLDQYQHELHHRQRKTYKILRSAPEDRRQDGIRLATMHRVKGLEFDHMIIAGVNANTVPLMGGHAQTSDTVIAREYETMERALLYVAATRARKSLLVTCFGKPSSFLVS
ncbi:UvrD-helicase domain-containing protein [Desulfonatronum thioautotrophicum]|uniref:UvrD-helicase domain-containing protein n=1 Tax=Desulfonatronum thioautotrophicum TaxID=617001 RepID=UPI0005EB3750|nr:UvrD-helicase domain-containing protein [Desulfonatronum thioautotrophicum]